MKELRERAAIVLTKIREQRPLVLCLTNSVVQNITANLLLAVGGVPVMLNHPEEIDDLLQNGANALLINVGTLSTEQAQLMRHAVQSAAQHRIPWVLDPVAVGLLRYRTAVCAELLLTPPAMVRGNASEIMALAGVATTACRGPESSAASTDAVEAAELLARRIGTAVLVTGAVDYISNGHRTYSCTNGHEQMTRITGMGCAMGALAAACTAVAENATEAALSTAAILGVCGELAARQTRHPGSLLPAILDTLDSITPEALSTYAKLAEVQA